MSGRKTVGCVERRDGSGGFVDVVEEAEVNLLTARPYLRLPLVRRLIPEHPCDAAGVVAVHAEILIVVGGAAGFEIRPCLIERISIQVVNLLR